MRERTTLQNLAASGAFGIARQRLGVRWVRGEGTHRYDFKHSSTEVSSDTTKAASALFPASRRTPKPGGMITKPLPGFGRCTLIIFLCLGGMIGTANAI